MKRALLTSLAVLFALTSVACGGKKGDGGGDSDNPFAKRKASIEAYFTAIEGAGDPEKAATAGQAWIDANKAAYLANCTALKEFASKLGNSAKGHETDYNAYMDRLNTAADYDPKKMTSETLKRVKPLMLQFNSFFHCDNALKTLK